jgi:hypothetical protein
LKNAIDFAHEKIAEADAALAKMKENDEKTAAASAKAHDSLVKLCIKPSCEVVNELVKGLATLTNEDVPSVDQLMADADRSASDAFEALKMLERDSLELSNNAKRIIMEANSQTNARKADGAGGESSMSDAAERARIKSVFPLRLPHEVLQRIEYLVYMNCIRDRKKVVHREMMDEEVYLTIVNKRTYDGRDYLGATRMPSLLSGVASDSDEWEFSDDDDGWGTL